jgi:hypothetical protein
MNKGQRSISVDEYLEYRRRQYALIADIDAVCNITAARPVTPTARELAWAEGDPDDLHVQLFARGLDAEYVISANTRHFPNRVRVGDSYRGELEGVVWITPADVF